MTEFNIVYFFNSLGQGTFIDQISILISNLDFLTIFWAVLVLISLFLDKKKGVWVFIAVITAVFFSYLIVNILFKDIFVELIGFRLRPYLAHAKEIIPLGEKVIDSSFPSGHMATTTALAFVFGYFYKKTWPAFLLLILAMAFSRIHNGMHYPTDVLGGVVLGLISAMISIALLARKLDKLT